MALLRRTVYDGVDSIKVRGCCNEAYILQTYSGELRAGSAIVSTIMDEQARRYNLLDRLQGRVRRFDIKTQQRLPYDLLASLASSLTDSAIFTIVDDLEEIQHLTEKDLYTKRQKLLSEQRSLRQKLNKKQADALQACRPHNLPILKAGHEKETEKLEKRLNTELRAFDEKLMTEIDNKVVVQQATLKSAGVPGFYVTTDNQAIKLQMVILNLIKELAKPE